MTNRSSGDTSPQPVEPTAVLVGDESLLVQCGEMLLDAGVGIAAVVSDDADIASWATDRQLGLLPHDDRLEAELGSMRFDYLLSITNLRMLSDGIIGQPTRLAINFHDGPLPAYAGLNATSWALLAGETSHGVTWHVMESGADRGDILTQARFEVGPEDTAFNLNVACYEHAIASFAELLPSLVSGSFDRRVQDLTERSYFARYRRPPGAGAIRWSDSTASIVNLVRALDLGPARNDVGRATALVGGRVMVVDRARAVGSTDPSNPDDSVDPGTVQSTEAGAVRVATGDGAVIIDSFTGSDGTSTPAAQVLTEAGLGVGDALGLPDAETLARLEAVAGELVRSERFWVDQLVGLDPTELPYARSSGVSGGDGNDRVEVPIGTEVLAALAEATDTDTAHPGETIDLGDTMAAAFACYLARLTGNEDIHLGLVNRFDEADEAIAPWFAPVVPVRCAVERAEPGSGGLARAVEAVSSARQRGSFPVDLGLRHPELTGLGVDAAALGLRIGIALDAASVDAGSPKAGSPDGGTGKAVELDLVLSIDPETGRCSLIRDRTAFPIEVVEAVAAQFARFAGQLADPDATRQPLATLQLLDPTDLDQIVNGWNDRTAPVDSQATIDNLFRARCRIGPDATAVVGIDATMTYAELDAEASRIANRLRAIGAGPGSSVGVMVERGAGMVAALLGTFRAGAAYVPLDPTYPGERLAFMVEDSGLEVLISQRSLADQRPAGIATVLELDGDRAAIDAASAEPPDAGPGPDDLAYLIYTSGSTGKPKGVMVSHANVVNFLAGMDQHIESDEGDRWLTVTSLSFDISVLEIFWTLTRGLELVVFPGQSQRVDQADAQSAASTIAGSPVAGAVTPTSDRELSFSLFYFASDEREARANEAYKLLLDGARFADEHGFEAVWTPERHFHAFGGLYPNPAVTGAAVAATTQRVAIRAGSCVLPLHHPARVAEEWAVVDNLSGGRVGIAFAAGWQPVDFLLRPENFADRKDAMIRDIDAVKRLWRGETLSFDGPTGPSEIQTLPRPIQPELPSWITVAGNPETFEAAGRGGHNVLTHLLGQTIDEVGDKIERYRQARREAGHEGDGQVTLMLHTFIGDDLDEVRRQVREPMIEYLRSSVSLIKEAAWSFPTFQQKSAETGQSPLDLLEGGDLTDEELEALLDHAFDRYFETSALFGTPSTCADMVERLRAIGVDEVACQIDFGVPAETVLDHLPLLDQLRARSSRPAGAQAAPTPGTIDAVTSSPAPDAGDQADEDWSIAALLARHDISHFQCTPSMGTMLLVDEAFRRAAANLKMFLMGGEAFPQALAKDVADLVTGTVLNVYGPTETTIWSSVHRVVDGDRPVPIGRPLANQQLYIVDGELQPCPVGVAGELLIGGDGVTPGYLDRPELNADRFVPDRFRPTVPGARLYRTGDLARYRPDGSIDFLGRKDFQVKIRGYRIELGEIEARLEEHPSVLNAVVIAREDTAGDQRLVAYLLAQSGHTIDSEALRQHLDACLPSFMVPAHYVELDTFPQTPNRKIDRAALPAPEGVTVTSSVAYVAPEQGIQSELVDMWQSLLGVERVGINENFFDLGGHSLLAVQLHRRIEATLGVQLSITDVFRFPTIASLTGHLDAAGSGDRSGADKAAKRGSARREALANRRGRRQRG